MGVVRSSYLPLRLDPTTPTLTLPLTGRGNRFAYNLSTVPLASGTDSAGATPCVAKPRLQPLTGGGNSRLTTFPRFRLQAEPIQPAQGLALQNPGFSPLQNEGIGSLTTFPRFCLQPLRRLPHPQIPLAQQPHLLRRIPLRHHARHELLVLVRIVGTRLRIEGNHRQQLFGIRKHFL